MATACGHFSVRIEALSPAPPFRQATIPSDAVRIHIPRGAADARAEPGSSHRSLLHTPGHDAVPAPFAPTYPQHQTGAERRGPCEAEVAQLHGGQIAHGVHVHENIGTLDVAMDHALVMDMLDGRCELHSDVDPLLGVDTLKRRTRSWGSC